MDIVRAVGTVLILGIAGFGIVDMLKTPEPKKPKTLEEQRAEKRSLAGYACERGLKEGLRDPDSWQHTNDFDPVGRVSNDGKHDYYVIVKGRAKNGFGGYVSAVYQCAFNYDNPNMYVKKLS